MTASYRHFLAMIPHHSIAIPTSGRDGIIDLKDGPAATPQVDGK